MELENLATSVGGLFGFADIVDDLKDIAILGGSAAASFVIGDFVFSKAPFLKDLSGWQKSIALIALGAAGGVALGKYVHRGVGAGFGAGLVGVGLKALISDFVPGLKGLGETEELLLGTDVTDYEPIPGQVNGVYDLEPQPGGSLGSWIQ